MGQKKLRFRSDEERISAVDEEWKADLDRGGDNSFVSKVYTVVRGAEGGSAGVEVRRKSAVPRSSRQDVKISFVSLPLGDVRDVDTKHDAAKFPWRWSWRLWLPFFDDAEPGEAETALNHVYAGTMARTASQVGIHPVDTVKTRLQVRDPPKKLRKWRQNISANAIGVGPVGIDNWLLKGPGDLFRGVTGAILGTIPNALLYFAAYEASKRKLKKLLPANWDGPIHVASASIGTVVASIVRVPADTMKHRVQAYMHSNVFEAFGSILATEGIAGLYRGFWPTLMRDVPEIAIQFGVYEKLRSFATEKRKVSKLTTPEHLLLGAFAGAIAATCTMPLDLVKTRQQCGVSASIPSIVVSVIHEKGVRGLFTGLGSRVLHVSLMSALFFSLFEYCKLVLKPGRDQYDSQIFPKIMVKRRDKIWKRQFVYTG
ncbi:hypothetical protein R1sor_023378 [Riccia sorocarpa]|uniref:Mitochondrial carrier protein n=1 Tax=Riccia sorocarpa TaxID=122646 RepID=A0ABD3GQG5_9MARC